MFKFCKKNSKAPLVWILTVVISVVVILWLILYLAVLPAKQNNSLNVISDPATVCTGLGGVNWLEDHNECEFVSETKCENLGGEYHSCESACRHSNAEFCTEQCVEVCKFK